MIECLQRSGQAQDNADIHKSGDLRQDDVEEWLDVYKRQVYGLPDLFIAQINLYQPDDAVSRISV